MRIEQETVVGLSAAIYMVGLFGGILYGLFYAMQYLPIIGTLLFWYMVVVVALVTVSEVYTMFNSPKYILGRDGTPVDCWENIKKMSYLHYVSYDAHHLYWKQLANIAYGTFHLFTDFLTTIKDMILAGKNVLVFVWLSISGVMGLRLFYNIIDSRKYAEISRKAEPQIENNAKIAWENGDYVQGMTFKRAYKKAKGHEREKIKDIFMGKMRVRKDLPLYKRIRDGLK